MNNLHCIHILAENLRGRNTSEFHNSCYEAEITLTLKPDKDITEKVIYSPITLKDIDEKQL